MRPVNTEAISNSSALAPGEAVNIWFATGTWRRLGPMVMARMPKLMAVGRIQPTKRLHPPPRTPLAISPNYSSHSSSSSPSGGPGGV